MNISEVADEVIAGTIWGALSIYLVGEYMALLYVKQFMDKVQEVTSTSNWFGGII